jgi:polyisoprenoid-binding protein YceI
MTLLPRFASLAIALASLTFTHHANAATDNYSIDKSHTRILFYVNHLGFSDTIGDFTSYNGSFTFDEKKPDASSVEFTLKPSGIRTSSETLDDHLQGEKFFNSKQFPDIRFVSTRVKVTGKNTGDITGNLTLLGVTKPVVLHVTFNKAGTHPFTKMYVAGFSAHATIKRSDFGMDHLIPMVSDEVTLQVQLEGVNETRKKAEALRK